MKMKQAFGLVRISLFFLLFNTFGCTKDCNTTNTTTNSSYPIQGLWIGTYSLDGSTTQYPLNFSIKPDGSMLYEGFGNGKQYVASGTWSLSSKVLTTSVTNIFGDIGVTQTATASWDSTGKLTNGVWKNYSATTGQLTAQGKYTLNRVN